MQDKQIEIRDKRRRQMFRIDDEYLDGGYSEICGAAATCVYMSLCRHADTRQECFPSIAGIAKQHGMTTRTVIRSIKKLEECSIITVIRRRDERTKRQMKNIYVLVDQSQWKSSRVTLGQPEPSDIRATGPGDKNDIKPGDTRAMEGNTEEKVTQREGSAAQGAPASTCAKEGCKNAPMRGRYLCENHEPMQCFQFVEWFRRHESRHIKIIAEWADELRISGRDPGFRTVAQWHAWSKPMMKAAKDLSVFDDDQIGAAIKRMMAADYVTDFNLHTLKTFLINAKK